MRKRGRILLSVVILAICGVSLWLTLRPHRDEIVQGKRESERISSFTNGYGSGGSFAQYQREQEEIKEWRALGPQGIEILCRALDKGSSRFTLLYLGYYNGLDDRFQRCLPKPVDTANRRQHAAFLLGSLAPENKDVAVPALIRALKRDPDADVRLNIIGHLDPELLRGKDKERLEILPELIKAAQSYNWGLRHNALTTFQMYPDRLSTVIPILTNALQDAEGDICWTAVTTLHQLAPDVAKPQIVEAITNMFHEQDEQFFLPGRIEWLGEMRKDALPAVPALLDALHSTNADVARAASHALVKIAPEMAEKKKTN
jgi:HEAT repeat protein